MIQLCDWSRAGCSRGYLAIALNSSGFGSTDPQDFGFILLQLCSGTSEFVFKAALKPWILVKMCPPCVCRAAVFPEVSGSHKQSFFQGLWRQQ
mmetsp:Transcript_63814/g.106512  ORF Transcript_63814/g.106512 Transcript_63814/m.106512 type:complete len:93 (-) Transcript_63814:357-635(-)